MNLCFTLAATLAIALSAQAVSAAPNAISGNHVTVVFGAEPEPHARVTFNKNRAAREALLIETFKAGAPGSTVSILVDGASEPVFRHVLTQSECPPADAAKCTIRISGKESMPGTLRNRFSRGRVSTIVVETSGKVEMSREVILNGAGKAPSKRVPR